MFSGASDSVRSPKNNFKNKNNLNLNGIAWRVLSCWRSQSNIILAAHPKTAEELGLHTELYSTPRETPPSKFTMCQAVQVMHSKIFDYCLSPGEELVDVFSSALLNTADLGFSLYLKRASSLSKLCCTIEEVQFSGRLQSNNFLFTSKAEFSISSFPFWSHWSQALAALFALLYSIALPKFGSFLIILVNKNRLLKVISISKNKIRLILFQYKLQKKILSVLTAHCALRYTADF